MKIERLPNRDKCNTFVDVGHRIKILRLECGLSQLELAELIGFKSATAISLIENGERDVNSTNIQKIAYACNIGIDKLFN